PRLDHAAKRPEQLRLQESVSIFLSLKRRERKSKSLVDKSYSHFIHSPVTVRCRKVEQEQCQGWKSSERQSVGAFGASGCRLCWGILFIVGKRGDGGGRREEAPSINIQAPEKFQISSSIGATKWLKPASPR